VIKAFERYAESVGLRQNVMLSATTGAAAGLIAAPTRPHSDCYGRHLRLLWWYACATSRSALHARCACSLTNSLDLDFQVCPLLIVPGDFPGFSQLDPAGGETVYCTADGGGHASRHGKHVWAQLNACIMLAESNRTHDPDLEVVLDALRTGVASPEAERLIDSRTFSKSASEQ
jgi:hypothetical protein